MHVHHMNYLARDRQTELGTAYTSVVKDISFTETEKKDFRLPDVERTFANLSWGANYSYREEEVILLCSTS